VKSFPVAFGAIVVTVVTAAVLYEYAVPHGTVSAPPTSSVTESKTSLSAHVASTNAASEIAATTAADASTPRDEAPASGPVSTSRPQRITATKAIKSPSKGATTETQNPVDLNANQSPGGIPVIPNGDQPASSSTNAPTSTSADNPGPKPESTIPKEGG